MAHDYHDLREWTPIEITRVEGDIEVWGNDPDGARHFFTRKFLEDNGISAIEGTEFVAIRKLVPAGWRCQVRRKISLRPTMWAD